MSVSDPVADFLTCVRNAVRARHRKVDVPASRLKTELAKLLLREKYITNFKVIEDSKQGILRIYLKYTPRACWISPEARQPPGGFYVRKTTFPASRGLARRFSRLRRSVSDKWALVAASRRAPGADL